MIDEALSDRSESTLREFTAWTSEIREALDQRLGHDIHAPLLETRLDSEWGHALSLHYQNEDRVWDTKNEVDYFTKMVESFKAQGVKWDPVRVFFLTTPSLKAMPVTLNADNVANQVNGWHQSESMGRRMHGKFGMSCRPRKIDFTGRDEVFSGNARQAYLNQMRKTESGIWIPSISFPLPIILAQKHCVVHY